MKLSYITESIDCHILSKGKDNDIVHLITDSRKAFDRQSGLFFAIIGPNHDGHDYIETLIQSGFQNFIVEKEVEVNAIGVNIIQVPSSIGALQAIAHLKRKAFNKSVLAIAGSNGKTIIKEWLSQLLSEKFNVCKSPNSFNSQIGVPLSVWRLNPNHDLGIFETGISQPGEMANLKKVIAPTEGIFTNIGSAHEQYFDSLSHKLSEKLQLFEGVQKLYFRNDDPAILTGIKEMARAPEQLISWGFNATANLIVTPLEAGVYRLKVNDKSFDLTLHSKNPSYIENILHCVCYAYFSGMKVVEIQKGIDALKPIKMRLELKKGINDSYIIDDTYNNDLGGLETALDFLSHQKQYAKKSIILSDILQSGSKEETYSKVASLLKEKGVSDLYGIGDELIAFQHLFATSSHFFSSTEEFLKSPFTQFGKEVILVKGARNFGFEKIVKQLQQRIHKTILEINLDAITHNLNFYRKKIKPETKLLVMVKALAYGSGGAEIANLLQFHQIDYFGVAYVDEGVQLRQNGITTPIMVINPSEDDLENLVEYDIEPEIYNFDQLQAFSRFYQKRGKLLKGHFTINTGMNRLGFDPSQVDELMEALAQHPTIKVQSLYTHLAASDEIDHQEFTLQQLNTFQKVAEKIETTLGIKTLKHALNSAGIVAYPQFQFDMVRLGIGLYGIEPAGILQNELKFISTLKTTISQIRTVEKGETVGYGRKGKVEHDMRIATIAIGYADGFSRIFSNGNGEVMVNGQMAKVVGNVCMDMTMIDVSGIEAEEGDSVIVFGEKPTISDLAQKANTIPYEILTNVSDRVKRIYYTE